MHVLHIKITSSLVHFNVFYFILFVIYFFLIEG